MRLDLHADFMRDTPTGPEQPLTSVIATVVEALPLQRQDAGQDKIQLFGATQDLGACRRVDRVRRARDGVGQRAHRRAHDKRIHSAHEHARQIAEEFTFAAFEHHQRGDRQTDAGGFAAANLAHYDFAAADAHVGRDQSQGHHRRIAGAAIPAAHGGLAIDGDLVRAFGKKLRRHRRMTGAHHQVQRFGHHTRPRRCDGGAPHLREESLGNVEKARFCSLNVLGYCLSGTCGREH